MHVGSCVCFLSLLGSCSKDDRDGNENVKKAIGLDKWKKTTTLREKRAFLKIDVGHSWDLKG